MRAPRILAVGMYTRLYDIQIASLMKAFAGTGIQVIERTYGLNISVKFIDIFWSLVRNVRRYDVVHCQVHSGFIMVAVTLMALWCRLTGKRMVAMYYGGGARDFFQRCPMFFRLVFSMIDEVVVAGDFMKGVFSELGVKVTVIPHIVDVDKWPKRLRKKTGNRLLWVRHLRDEYNPFMLLEVFRKLRALNTELRLDVVGRGNLAEAMARHIEQNEITGIRLLGRVSDEELKRLFNEADVFINTSRVDNQPVSVLEAMSSGVPVVSTDAGGIPDIIDSGVNGMLSKEGDADAMVASFRRLTNDTELYAAVSRRGMASVEERFGVPVILRHWNEVYGRMGFVIGRG